VTPTLRRRIVAAVERADRLRCPVSTLEGPTAHKEWHHFAVFGTGFDLLMNLSVCDDGRPAASRRSRVGHTTILLRDRGWAGAVERFTAEEVTALSGDHGIRCGPCSMRLVDGEYLLDASLPEQDVALQLRLRPVAFPMRGPRIPLVAGPPLNWLVVPRLEACGSVVAGDRRHRVAAAPAYHDHNWGGFFWGEDFSWQWALAVPDGEHGVASASLALLCDRARNRLRSQTVVLWGRGRRHWVFRDAEIEVRPSSRLLRRAPGLRVPTVMALVHPDLATDMPAEVTVVARRAGDWLEWVFRASDLAQVIVPSETDLGISVFNEVVGRSQLRGTLDGEPFDVECRSVFELLTA
jgi:hypothetical protein